MGYCIRKDTHFPVRQEKKKNPRFHSLSIYLVYAEHPEYSSASPTCLQFSHNHLKWLSASRKQEYIKVEKRYLYLLFWPYDLISVCFQKKLALTDVFSKQSNCLSVLNFGKSKYLFWRQNGNWALLKKPILKASNCRVANIKVINTICSH